MQSLEAELSRDTDLGKAMKIFLTLQDNVEVVEGTGQPVNVLEWPHSPDLNPITRLWRELKQAAHGRPLVKLI